jgi:hypothetical protein
MIEATMAFIAERAKFTSKSSNVNAVAKFYTTLDDAQILLVANNCNNYFYNDYNNASIFGAKSLTNNNYETYIGTMKNKAINKIASFTNNNISLNTQTTILGNIIPASNISYDIGSSNFKWRDLYLSGNTIYLGDTLISADTSNGTLMVTDKNKKIVDINNLSATITSTSNSIVRYINTNTVLGSASQWTTNNGYINYNNIHIYPNEIRISNPAGVLIDSYVYYEFKSQALLVVDSSANGITLNNNGGSYELKGTRNSILLQNGDDATMSVDQNWSTFNDFSISGWFNTSGSANNDKLLEFDASSIYSTQIKYPPTLLTTTYSATYTSTYDSTTKTFQCKSSTEYSASLPAYKAFNGVLYANDPTSGAFPWATAANTYNTSTSVATNTNNFFNTDSSFYGEWMMVDLGEPIILEKYIIYPHNLVSTNKTRCPQDFRIYATNDTTSWTNSANNNSANSGTRSGQWVLIDTRTGITDYTDNTPRTFTLSTLPTTEYRYYALIANKLQASLDFSTLQFSEMEFYGKAAPIIRNILITKSNTNLSFQINNTTVYQTPYALENTWTHILWNIKNATNTPFVRISTTSMGTEQTYTNVSLLSGTYTNKLGSISNTGSVNISDFRLFTTPLTTSIKNNLYSPTATYTILVDDAYIQSTSSILQTQISRTSNNLANYVTITSNAISNRVTASETNVSNYVNITSNQLANAILTTSNSIVNTSNAISGRVTTLDTRVTSLDTNMSNYLNTTSNTLGNSLVYTSNALSSRVTTLDTRVTSLDTNMSNYLNTTSNTLANSLAYTSNALSSRVTTLDTRVTSLDTNMSNYLNTTSNTLANSLVYTSNVLSSRITNLSADQIADGTTKRFIIGNTYNNDLIVKGKLTASNLDIIGETTTIKTNTYQTENLEIITQATDGPAFKIVQSGPQNLVDMYDTNSNVFTVTKAGKVGIANANPSEKLDVLGNIKFTGSINSVTSTQLDYVNGVTSSIQTQLNNTNTFTSNYITISSNILANSLVYTSNALSSRVTTLDTRVTSLDTNMSNYLNTTSNTLANSLVYTSNALSSRLTTLDTRVTSLDTNMSNYLNTTSNTLANSLVYTSNALSSRVTTLDTRVTSLDTNMSNYLNTTSNTLANSLVYTSNTISSRVTTLDKNISNYVNTTSNAILNKVYSLDSNVSNFIIKSTLWTLSDNYIKYNNVEVYSNQILINQSLSTPYWARYEFLSSTKLNLDSSGNNRTLTNNNGTYQYNENKNSILLIPTQDFTLQNVNWSTFSDFTIAGWFKTVNFTNQNILLEFKSAPEASFTNTANLQVWYKFNDDATNMFLDYSGNNYTATSWQNLATFDSNNYKTGTGSLLCTNSANFNFTSSLNLYSVYNGNGISISFWFKTNSNSVYILYLQNGNGRISINVDTSYKLRFYHNDISFPSMIETIVQYTTASVYANNNWHHVVWSIATNGAWTIYIDNTNLNVSISPLYPLQNRTYSSYVLSDGGPGNGLYINFDDFRLYNKILSNTDINALYTLVSNKNIKINNNNNNLSFQINDTPIYETPFAFNNSWNHIIWNITNSSSVQGFVKINNGSKILFNEVALSSDIFINKLGAISNTCNIYISDFKILNIPITTDIETILYSPYKTLIDDLYLQNTLTLTSNILSSRITILDTNMSNYLNTTCNTLANSLVNTSNAISSRVTSLETNMSNYLNTTSNILVNSFINTSNSLISYINTKSQWTTNTGYISYSNIQVYENEIRINNLQNNQTSNYIYYEFKSQALLTTDSSGNNKTLTTSGIYQFNDSRNSLFLASNISATMPVENWSNFGDFTVAGWFKTSSFVNGDKLLEFIAYDLVHPITTSPSITPTLISGNEYYVAFTNSSTSTNANYTITFTQNVVCDVLIVGGGGGGGNSSGGSRSGAGGGAGQVIYLSQQSFSSGSTLNVSVAKGGAGKTGSTGGNGADGGSTTFGTYTAVGGGGGAGPVAPQNGNNGASGGGSAGGTGGTLQGIVGIAQTQGTTGYNGGQGGIHYMGGGGGGFTSAGQNCVWGVSGGQGGSGINYNITGVSLGYAGGGGGGGYNQSSTFNGITQPGTLGGTATHRAGAGGGAGQSLSPIQPYAGENAVNGSGSGGGGASGANTGVTSWRNGGNGGTGTVIIRYSIVAVPKNIKISYNNTANANKLSLQIDNVPVYEPTFTLNNTWTHIIWNILNNSSTIGFVKINGIKQTFLQPSLLSLQSSNIIGSITNLGNLYVSDLRIITTPITTTIENALYSSYTKLVDDSYIQNTIPWKNTNNSIYCFQNVGIGTNNANYNLDIMGTNATLRLIDTATSGNTIIAFKEQNDNNGFDLAYIGNTDDNFYIRTYNNSSTANVRLSINRNTGNIGIGTTNPTSKLHIIHNSSNISPESSGGIGLYVYNNQNIANYDSVICNRIAGNNADKVVYSLDVESYFGWSMYLQGSDTTNKTLRFNSAFDTTGTDRFVIRGSDGNVGIGTTNPNAVLDIKAGTNSIAPILLRSGNNLSTVTAGTLEYDGVVPYFSPSGNYRGIIPSVVYNTLNSTRAFANVATAQQIFATNITLLANTTYEMEIIIYKIRTASTGTAVANTINLSFTGTATITSIGYSAIMARVSIASATAPQSMTYNTSTASTVIGTTFIGLNEYQSTTIKGIVRVNAGGTFIPNMIYSAAPVTTPTSYADNLQPNTYIKLTPIGVGNVTTVGNTYA